MQDGDKHIQNQQALFFICVIQTNFKHTLISTALAIIYSPALRNHCSRSEIDGSHVWKRFPSAQYGCCEIQIQSISTSRTPVELVSPRIPNLSSMKFLFTLK